MINLKNVQLLKDADIKNKKVLVRVDFNVPLDEQGRVADDFKIRSTLPTINYLVEQGARIILMSHFGKPGGKFNKKYSLKLVGEKLAEYIGQKVQFAPDCVGTETKNLVVKLLSGQVLLLENLRFYPGEEANDPIFAQNLANLAEIYINDAFAECHRDYASMTTITKFMPSYAGLLLEKEVQNLSRAKDNPGHPLAVIIGGAKISTKIKLIQSFLGKAQNILLGGALANTVLQAQGIAIGKSLTEEAMLPEVKNLKITDTKIHLPVDVILSKNKQGASSCYPGPVGKTGEDEFILDIGPDTEKLFAKIVANAKMIIWNGPMGFFEAEATSHGTKAMAEAIANSQAYSIVGGGETVTYLEKNNLLNKFSFVSTGGGAMLEFLSGEPMPGIEALEVKS